MTRGGQVGKLILALMFPAAAAIADEPRVTRPETVATERVTFAAGYSIALRASAWERSRGASEEHDLEISFGESRRIWSDAFPLTTPRDQLGAELLRSLPEGKFGVQHPAELAPARIGDRVGFRLVGACPGEAPERCIAEIRVVQIESALFLIGLRTDGQNYAEDALIMGEIAKSFSIEPFRSAGTSAQGS